MKVMTQFESGFQANFFIQEEHRTTYFIDEMQMFKLFLRAIHESNSVQYNLLNSML